VKSSRRIFAVRSKIFY